MNAAFFQIYIFGCSEGIALRAAVTDFETATVYPHTYYSYLIFRTHVLSYVRIMHASFRLKIQLRGAREAGRARSVAARAHAPPHIARTGNR